MRHVCLLIITCRVGCVEKSKAKCYLQRMTMRMRYLWAHEAGAMTLMIGSQESTKPDFFLSTDRAGSRGRREILCFEHVWRGEMMLQPGHIGECVMVCGVGGPGERVWLGQGGDKGRRRLGANC